MTVTSHIAEILRQGIWGSLTGGWYYEPSHSIFCNTVHLYLWLLLLIVPLIIGLISSGVFSLTIMTGYTCFIALLFTILKVMVSYLHTVFDTSEPIVMTRLPYKNDSEDSMTRDAEITIEQPYDSGLEMVELREIRRRVDAREILVDPHPRSRFYGSSGEQRHVRIDNDVPEIRTNTISTVQKRHSQKADNSDLPMNKVMEIEDATIGEDSDNDDIHEQNKLMEEELVTIEDGGVGQHIKRKMSEPVMASHRWNDDHRRDSDASDDSHVCRSNSTFESRLFIKRAMLSQISLDQAKQSTRKSYLSKMSGIEEFKTDSLSNHIGKINTASTSENPIPLRVDSDATLEKMLKNEVDRIHITGEHLPVSVIDDDDGTDLPTTSSRCDTVEHSAPYAVLATEDNGPKRRKNTRGDEAIPSTSGWTPVVVSLSGLDRPRSSSFSRHSDEQGDGSDIKVEITRFLEELIDKHPETLDAIENVRLSRLSRASAHQRAPPILRLHGSRRRPSTSVSALSDLALRDGTHVASGHEDTSQGAIHSFQDEDGTWWTYAFDEHGVGTAQPLGSGRALMELLQSGQEMPVGMSRLDVLPESAYVSSEDEGEACCLQQAAAISGRTIASTRRERALSSSSNESYTHIPQLPTSVLHAPTGTGASRASSRHSQMVSFVNVASRLRAAVRQAGDATAQEGETSTTSHIIRNILERRNGVRARGENHQERLLFRLDSGSSDGGISSRIRLLSELGLTTIPSGTMGTAGNTSVDYSASTRRPSSIKKSYYYKMFPKTSKSFKLKMDRLSVSALFDRNRTVFSCVFDVILAGFVALMACFVLSTGIYFDISLVFFAFTVAGAHFSLLKSVQPDAASPIHGFNWLVVYSRPVYFCVLSIIILFLHHLADDLRNDKLPWNWNPYRLPDASWEMILLAVRDLFATFLIMLPFAFTMGWLPQVNTLSHHILEQLEMHVFGGTASLGVFSAVIQLIKSICAWGSLVGLYQVAMSMDSPTTQTPSFSAFLAVAVGMSYLLSRFSSNPQLFLVLFNATLFSICDCHCSNDSSQGHRLLCSATRQPSAEQPKDEEELDVADPLPSRLRSTVVMRARHDLLFAAFLSVVVFAIHSTSLFSATQPYFTLVIVPLCITFGIINHYLYQQLRTHTPWKLIAKPILRSREYCQFESPEEACLMPFEFAHVWMLAIEKNLLYPLVAVSILTECGWSLPQAPFLAPLIVLRLLRGGFSHPQLIYVPLALSFIATRFDWRISLPFDISKGVPSTTVFPLILYSLIIIYPKWLELYLKLNFVMAYVAPWQISWGSAFHAFAQPFSIPHSALIWIQTVISSVISAPLNPFLGSSFFTTSYVRPIKFWERDYNTRRSDASNTRLASQIDRGPMLDDSNLNAVFYEHLTRSLQKSLAGDLLMGRWATSVQPGDCFILASFYLNCLVHIIEVGNGFITFQLRGLEFRGTYCHQREVEAISEDQTEGTGCCCCSPGSLPGFLSLNTAWGLRWLAWEVVTGKYIIDGYSITDNSAVNLLQVHELRRLLVTLYVKCIIYYTISSNKLGSWLSNDTVRATLDPIVSNTRYADIDHIFCSTNDEDFDINEMGISRVSFSEWYSVWINYCIQKRMEKNVDETMDADIVNSLCFVLSLLGRRALGAASYNRHSNAAESFLYGLHALFKGDFRITCQRDEWVFADMDLLRCVISPAVKMALKLHQDHFAASDDFDDPESLFNLIAEHQIKLFISHEHDPAWRRAIISNTPSLLALRHMYDDGQDEYKIIMLNKMHLNMRVIKLNRECVRAFWAGQQQELIFLRNRNPERGSIQNARQVLRNMINSSADQPVGYPIYVSPLTTSFAETHSQMDRIIGPPVTVEGIANVFRRAWSGLRSHFGPSGSSSLGVHSGCIPPVPPSLIPSQAPVAAAPSVNTTPSIKPSLDCDVDRSSCSSTHVENSIVHMTPDGGAKVTLARRVVNTSDTTPTNNKRASRVSGTGETTPIVNNKSSCETPSNTIIKRVSVERKADVTDRESVDKEESVGDDIDDGVWVQITDIEQVFRYLNEPLKSTGEPLVVWPNEEIRMISGRSAWYCQPMDGWSGRIVFTWYPNHRNRKLRSHIGDAIHLLAIPVMASALVPVSEKGCRILTPEEAARHQSLETKREHQAFIKKIQSELGSHP